MAQFYVLKSERQYASVSKLMPFHTEEADDCCAAVHTFPGATSTCTVLQPDTFKWWSLLQIEIARHGWSWEEFRWVICFLAYWCWYPVMLALATSRRAQTLKLACCFPLLRRQALMRAFAFTLHLPSPLSPTHTVSSHAGFCRAGPSMLLRAVLIIPIFPITLSSLSLLPHLCPEPSWPPCISRPLFFYTLLNSLPRSFPLVSSSPHLFHPREPAVLSDTPWSLWNRCKGIK